MRRRFGSVLLALVLLASCSTEPERPAPLPEGFYRSGSRLRISGHEADGIFVPDSLFDTHLNMDCVAAIASDGVERCVPREAPPVGPSAGWADGSPDYKDGCSTVILTIPKATCIAPESTLVRETNRQTRNGDDYWRIGPPTTATELSAPSFGECVAVGRDPAYEYYERGELVPPSSFAALVTHDVDVSPTLRISVTDGEDGSRFPSDRDYVDRTRDLPCVVRFTDDGASRCAPMAGYRYSAGRFTDIDCKIPAAASHCTYRSCNDAVAIEPYGSCPDDHARFYQLGSTVDRARERSGPDCQWSRDDDGSYAELRAPIDAATFPAVELRKRTHTRLVERTLLVNGTGVEQSSIFDPRFEDECRFEQAGDGQYRCLPTHAAPALQRYADASCTKPAFWVDTSCSRTSKYGRIVEGDPCNPRTRIYKLLPAGKGFSKVGPDGPCVDSGFEETLFAPGDEIPSTAFVEGYSAMR